MGQDTSSVLGAMVSVKYNYENIEILRKLFTLVEENNTFITKDDGYDDEYETLDYIAEVNHNIKDFDGKCKQFALIKNQDDFDNFLPTINNQIFTVMLSFTSTYARNISRRRNPSILGDLGENTDELIDKINNCRKKFLDIGIPKELIKLGYTFRDS
jgi:hypothetical protein